MKIEEFMLIKTITNNNLGIIASFPDRTKMLAELHRSLGYISYVGINVQCEEVAELLVDIVGKIKNTITLVNSEEDLYTLKMADDLVEYLEPTLSYLNSVNDEVINFLFTEHLASGIFNCVAKMDKESMRRSGPMERIYKTIYKDVSVLYEAIPSNEAKLEIKSMHKLIKSMVDFGFIIGRS